MANALPGPITTKVSIVTGYKVAGALGALVSILGLLLPSTILIFILTAFYLKYKDLSVVKGSLKGVRPAVIALLFVVIYNIFPSSINSWHTGLIAVATFCFVAFWHIHPAVLIAAAALIGLGFYR
jgi:chromate transporter